MSDDFVLRRTLLQNLAEACNERSRILDDLCTAHAALRALENRASGIEEMGDREVDLYRDQIRLIAVLVNKQKEIDVIEDALDKGRAA